MSNEFYEYQGHEMWSIDYATSNEVCSFPFEKIYLVSFGFFLLSVLALYISFNHENNQHLKA